MFLGNNKITAIPIATSPKGFGEYEELDISNNLLRELTELEIQSLEKVKTLHLFGNPWKCSCKLEDRLLMNFLHRHDQKPCCPNTCSCDMNKDFMTININCTFANSSVLPICLPYSKAEIDYSYNQMKTLTFTNKHENITSRLCKFVE